MNFHFLTTPPVGTVMLLDEQRYELIAVEPYQRSDGQASKLLTWRAPCADCGAPFEIKTGLKGKDINRRCVAHRASCKPVSGKYWQKMNVVVIEPQPGVEASKRGVL